MENQGGGLNFLNNSMNDQFVNQSQDMFGDEPRTTPYNFRPRMIPFQQDSMLLGPEPTYRDEQGFNQEVNQLNEDVYPNQIYDNEQNAYLQEVVENFNPQFQTYSENYQRQSTKNYSRKYNTEGNLNSYRQPETKNIHTNFRNFLAGFLAKQQTNRNISLKEKFKNLLYIKNSQGKIQTNFTRENVKALFLEKTMKEICKEYLMSENIVTDIMSSNITDKKTLLSYVKQWISAVYNPDVLDNFKQS